MRRLGGTRSEPVDVWIVAATNEDLDGGHPRAAVPRGPLPPARGPARFACRRCASAATDVVLLAEHFLARACADYGLPREDARRRTRARPCCAYPWPGNVRELANVMERVALLGDGPT